MSEKNGRNNGLFGLVGLCSFLCLMCNGFIWIAHRYSWNFNWLGQVENIAKTVLYVIALISGWIWLANSKMNKTAKIIFTILFIFFAVLCICGQMSWF